MSPYLDSYYRSDRLKRQKAISDRFAHAFHVAAYVLSAIAAALIIWKIF